MARRETGRRAIGQYIRAPDGEPIPAFDVLTWARWFEKNDRRVARTEIGPYTVSTVFLGLDHNLRDGPPILWETMVFGPKGDVYSDRYTSQDAALAGHEKACQWVRDTRINEEAEKAKVVLTIVPMRIKA